MCWCLASIKYINFQADFLELLLLWNVLLLQFSIFLYQTYIFPISSQSKSFNKSRQSLAKEKPTQLVLKTSSFSLILKIFLMKECLLMFVQICSGSYDQLSSRRCMKGFSEILRELFRFCLCTCRLSMQEMIWDFENNHLPQKYCWLS